MPIGLDFSGISIAEGVRAALATSSILVVNEWVGSLPLLIVAMGAMITCFCDTGGSLRQRLPMLLSFTVLGALTWAGFGLLRGFGLAVVLPVAGLSVFLLSMARVWGIRSQTVGNVLIVVLALAIDMPLTPGAALTFLVAFLVGGLWASLLTLVIWRIQSDRPATRALASVWAMLAALAADLLQLVRRRDVSRGDWEAHARGHRRAVRAAIEEARSLVGSSVRANDLGVGRGTQALVLLETADQVFRELIILSELLESSTAPAPRLHAERLLRRLRPVLLLLSFDHPPDTAKLRTTLDRIARDTATVDDLRSVTAALVDRIRVVTRLLDGTEQPNLRAETVQPGVNMLLSRIWGPLRDELTWRSAILRHAVRATVLTVPAIAITLLWWTPYAHWLTITVALTMQPFFAATWQRALERIGGTVLGALIGGALSFFPQTPIIVACLLVPLSILGFSVRQVSYGAYIACLTPLIVLVFDVVEPGHSSWVVAGMRTFYTLVGGGAAVAACMLLWPSWEPNRLKRELRQTLLAYRDLSAALLGPQSPQLAKSAEGARRAAGLANSNLEAALSRALKEPLGGNRTELDKIIAADAILRRAGAAMLATPHDPSLAGILDGPERDSWREWLDAAFEAVAEGRGLPSPAPAAPENSTLQRVRRALEVLSQDLMSSRVLPA